MKSGFRVEMSADELSVVITACSVRLQELGAGIEKAAKMDDLKSVEFLLEKHKELRAALRLLENAEYFLEMGGLSYDGD